MRVGIIYREGATAQSRAASRGRKALASKEKLFPSEEAAGLASALEQAPLACIKGPRLNQLGCKELQEEKKR